MAGTAGRQLGPICSSVKSAHAQMNDLLHCLNETRWCRRRRWRGGGIITTPSSLMVTTVTSLMARMESFDFIKIINQCMTDGSDLQVKGECYLLSSLAFFSLKAIISMSVFLSKIHCQERNKITALYFSNWVDIKIKCGLQFAELLLSGSYSISISLSACHLESPLVRVKL